MFNGSFPHHFSYAQKNIPWRQVVKKHFETKKNVINRRCVYSNLIPLKFWSANIFLSDACNSLWELAARRQIRERA